MCAKNRFGGESNYSLFIRRTLHCYFSHMVNTTYVLRYINSKLWCNLSEPLTLTRKRNIHSGRQEMVRVSCGYIHGLIVCSRLGLSFLKRYPKYVADTAQPGNTNCHSHMISIFCIKDKRKQSILEDTFNKPFFVFLLKFSIFNLSKNRRKQSYEPNRYFSEAKGLCFSVRSTEETQGKQLWVVNNKYRSQVGVNSQPKLT